MRTPWGLGCLRLSANIRLSDHHAARINDFPCCFFATGIVYFSWLGSSRIRKYYSPPVITGISDEMALNYDKEKCFNSGTEELEVHQARRIRVVDMLLGKAIAAIFLSAV